MSEICKLCHNRASLVCSHIIPQFIYKWLKDTSATGYLRFGQEPNRRVQDGFAERLFCRKCEDLLNKLETDFANRLFYPFVRETKSPIEYGPWLLRFAVSLSWRSLMYSKNFGLSHFTSIQEREADSALEVWRLFLLGKGDDVGEYAQHVLPLGITSSWCMAALPKNMNRYLLRSVEIEPIASESEALIYVKIPCFIVLGMIQFDQNQWINTRVSAEKGIIPVSEYSVPRSFGDYIVEKANRFGDILANMSERQTAKIEKAVLSDPHRALNSWTFKATDADIRLLGNDVLE